ncbi:MAG: hypothetical protein OEW30_16580 [Acidimicrobiia bacterium]|nr:hypothetical protein [Acidimicrobiia bacterium]MDH5294084.1 hypothetical protein [Acidimicrobiia bacterium]
MSTDAAAQLAMTLNFVTLIVLAAWLYVPWARRRSLVAALTPLVAVHTGRTVALQLFSSQAAGYPISDALRDEIVWGDQLGFVIALLTLVALWRAPKLARPLTWLLVVATVVDLANALIGGLAEEILGAATDVSWLILTFYVPLLWVTTGLMAWVLLTNRVSPAESTPPDKVLWADRFGEVLDRPGIDAVEIRWFGATADLDRAGFNDWLDRFASSVEGAGRSRIVTDATSFAMSPEQMDGAWRDAHIIPRYNRAGIQKFAFIMPAGMPAIGTAPAIEGPATFPTAYFGDRAEAIRWLSGE